MVMEIEIPLS